MVMAVEIERKFLVINDNWRRSVNQSIPLRQGYLSQSGTASVRVRRDAKHGWINIKSVVLGVQREEFEYEIPLSDADQMLETLARKPLIEKTRHFTKIGAHTWEIDEFEGLNAGLIVAEIELSEPDEYFEHPAWIGAEVTQDPRYYNTNLAQKPYADW
jgi:adenylate cyclase